MSSVTPSYLESVHDKIRHESADTAVAFFYLPRPPKDERLHEKYLQAFERKRGKVPTFRSLPLGGSSAVTDTRS